MSITPVKVGKLEYLRDDRITVPHCFTTRQGGVSEGYLASLNIGVHRGDKPENVLENLRILGDAVGFATEDLVACRQTHSDIVLPVGRAHTGYYMAEGASREGDALITNTPGVGLVVFTADCTPILLQDPVTGAVGAVHAGWRGSAAGIAAKTVTAMADTYGCDPKNIRAAIGPNIGPCCFQTDADVPSAMVNALGSDAEAWIRPQGNKFYVNLKEINALWLRRAGVEQIAISPLCTACRQDLFWSHRKVGQQRGSQGAIIICKEVTP